MGGLLGFLLGCLVLVVVLYIAKVVMEMIPLPAQVKQIAYLILGLIALLVLINLAMRAMGNGGWGMAMW